jgi:hypothetical protein
VTKSSKIPPGSLKGRKTASILNHAFVNQFQPSP